MTDTPTTVIKPSRGWGTLLGAEEQRRDWTTAASAVLVLLVTGAYYFRRTERTIVDMI